MHVDQAWLDAINAERKKEQSGPISYEVFEIIVDKLEKEWFELVSSLILTRRPADDRSIDQEDPETRIASSCRGFPMCDMR